MGGMLSGASGGSGVNASGAAEIASESQYKAANIATAEMKRQFDQTRADKLPWQKAGEQALTKQNVYAGLGGSAAQKAAFDNYLLTPQQTFYKQQGMDALNRNSVAIGGIGSPRVQAALATRGANVAAQGYESDYNRLAGLSGTGQATAGQIGALGQTNAQGIGAINMKAANSAASGIMAGQQADSAAKGQVAGAVLTTVATIF